VKFLNYDGRLMLLDDEGRGIDVSKASEGKIPASVPEAYERWDQVVAWAASYAGAGEIEIDEALIGPPSPAPRQTLGVGLNYASHAEESNSPIPEVPMIFPKFFAATAGPYEEIPISTEMVDWEVELAVVISKQARGVGAADVWDYVAGFTVGQDFSERGIQGRPAGAPQFSLGKSLPKFGPIGPALTTLDEFEDPEALDLSCTLNGEVVQRGNTSDFIFTIPQVIEYLSWATVLYPGDVILTGTPSGIGATRKPPVFLAPGDVVESEVAGIGTMRHTFVAEQPKIDEPVLSAGQG
jgi:2,4-didehydro-3-deoxy-L-rhamnonate hydrolase